MAFLWRFFFMVVINITSFLAFGVAALFQKTGSTLS